MRLPHFYSATLAVLVVGGVVEWRAQVGLPVWLVLPLLPVMATGAHWGLDVAASLLPGGAVYLVRCLRPGERFHSLPGIVRRLPSRAHLAGVDNLAAYLAANLVSCMYIRAKTRGWKGAL